MYQKNLALSDLRTLVSIKRSTRIITAFFKNVPVGALFVPCAMYFDNRHGVPQAVATEVPVGAALRRLLYSTDGPRTARIEEQDDFIYRRVEGSCDKGVSSCTAERAYVCNGGAYKCLSHEHLAIFHPNTPCVFAVFVEDGPSAFTAPRTRPAGGLSGIVRPQQKAVSSR
jgi:hypothetical protein